MTSTRVSTTTAHPGTAPQKKRKASGGGLEFSGVGVGAQSHTKSVPRAYAAPIPTATVTTPSATRCRCFIGFQIPARVVLPRLGAGWHSRRVPDEYQGFFGDEVAARYDEEG